MNFTKGQVIVHPHHGPATITKTTTRTLRGTRIRYLKLQVSGTDLVVEVPEERAEETGLRPVLGIEDLREIFEVLAAPSEEEPSNWSRRIKANTDRFRSGDIRTISGLVRDLARRLDDKGLSFGEKNLLRDAMIPLVAEISIVLSMDEAETESTIDAAILQGTIPQMPALAAAS